MEWSDKLKTIELIRYPTAISPIRLPVLTQQIMADFQLSQEAWKKLNSQRNKMAEMNKFLMKVVKTTYKKLTSVPKQYPKKTHNIKTFKKMVNPTKDIKNLSNTHKRKNDSDNSKKIVISETKTVIGVQVSDFYQSMDTEDRDNDSMG